MAAPCGGRAGQSVQPANTSCLQAQPPLALRPLGLAALWAWQRSGPGSRDAEAQVRGKTLPDQKPRCPQCERAQGMPLRRLPGGGTSDRMWSDHPAASQACGARGQQSRGSRQQGEAARLSGGQRRAEVRATARQGSVPGLIALQAAWSMGPPVTDKAPLATGRSMDRSLPCVRRCRACCHGDEIRRASVRRSQAGLGCLSLHMGTAHGEELPQAPPQIDGEGEPLLEPEGGGNPQRWQGRSPGGWGSGQAEGVGSRVLPAGSVPWAPSCSQQAHPWSETPARGGGRAGTQPAPSLSRLPAPADGLPLADDPLRAGAQPRGAAGPASGEPAGRGRHLREPPAGRGRAAPAAGRAQGDPEVGAPEAPPGPPPARTGPGCGQLCRGCTRPLPLRDRAPVPRASPQTPGLGEFGLSSGGAAGPGPKGTCEGGPWRRRRGPGHDELLLPCPQAVPRGHLCGPAGELGLGPAELPHPGRGERGPVLPRPSRDLHPAC